MIEESLLLDGHERLAAKFAYPEEAGLPMSGVLICPPHPFLGGDMDNNVVQALSAALAAAGLPVLRFNYRGIGGSSCVRDLGPDQREFWRDSTCPAYESEIRVDCADAFAALQALLPAGSRLSVIGYSFGCLPALDIARRTPLAKLCLISPPLAKWAIAPTAFDLPCPRQLCYAPDDFACPEALIRELQRTAPGACEIHAFADADHFFIGQEARLADTVARFMVSA